MDASVSEHPVPVNDIKESLTSDEIDKICSLLSPYPEVLVSSLISKLHKQKLEVITQ